jgi:hypothetical protein
MLFCTAQITLRDQGALLTHGLERPGRGVAGGFNALAPADFDTRDEDTG